MTTSITIWFLFSGLIILIGYFGIKVFLGDILKLFHNSLFALAAASGILFLGLAYLRKYNEKKKVVIEIIDKKNCYLF